MACVRCAGFHVFQTLTPVPLLGFWLVRRMPMMVMITIAMLM